MNTVQALNRAEELLAKHESLKDWKIVYNNGKRVFGQCFLSKKQINLSYTLTSLNPFEHVKKVILHEIAHALTPGAHHNYTWRAKLLEIGGDGERCYGSEVTNPPKPYQYVCVQCGPVNIFRYKRSTRAYTHPKCGKSLMLKKRLQSEMEESNV